MRVTLREMVESGNFDAAMQILDDTFIKDPASDEALFYFCSLLLHTEHPGPARFILRHIAERNPEKWQAWLNLGIAYDQLEMWDQSMLALERAHELAPDDHKIVAHLSGVAANAHRWDECIQWANKALQMRPSLQAEISKAFAFLHKGKHGRGWDLYAKGVGHQKWRDRRSFGGAPQYNGEKDAKVVIYGEQGIGDQIAYLSALPDAMSKGLHVSGISCYPKMASLFRDTFPGVEVQGTQFEDSPPWETPFSHIMPMSHLMKWYRRKRADYSGEPYLKTNPAKGLQWRALLEQCGTKPKVGIAWRGGKRGAHSWRHKSMTLEDLLPILKLDLDWVCLEYKDASEEIATFQAEHGIVIRDWPWGTQTEDYSDTAALVAQLDAVVTVPTSVCHLGGGLGIPTYCLKHEFAHFHYGAGMPYYSSVELFKREQVEDVAERLKNLENVSKIRQLAT